MRGQWEPLIEPRLLCRQYRSVCSEQIFVQCLCYFTTVNLIYSQLSCFFHNFLPCFFTTAYVGGFSWLSTFFFSQLHSLFFHNSIACFLHNSICSFLSSFFPAVFLLSSPRVQTSYWSSCSFLGLLINFSLSSFLLFIYPFLSCLSFTPSFYSSFLIFLCASFFSFMCRDIYIRGDVTSVFKFLIFVS